MSEPVETLRSFLIEKGVKHGEMMIPNMKYPTAEGFLDYWVPILESYIHQHTTAARVDSLEWVLKEQFQDYGDDAQSASWILHDEKIVDRIASLQNQIKELNDAT